MLGGKVEDSTEVLGEETVRGGVCPRAPLRLTDSEELCVSEEDRSSGAGLLENSRRKALPKLEDHLVRVSPLSKQSELLVVSRTIPEDGAADNLSLTGGSLIGPGGEVFCPEANWAQKSTQASVLLAGEAIACEM